jgi:hypothetical protein
MTKEELAGMLDGREYGDEITDSEETEAKESELVVVFGYSDDNVELRGAINEEVGAWEGTTLHIDKKGILQTDCENEDCPYFAEKLKDAKTIKAIWSCLGYSWIYETDIPHATFEIMEDGEKYCRGIVFSLMDL